MLCTVRTSWQHSLLWLCLICSTRHTGNPPMWSPSFSDRYVQSHLLNTGTKLKIVFHFAVRQRHLRYSQGVCYSHCLFYFFVLLCIFEIKKFYNFQSPLLLLSSCQRNQISTTWQDCRTCLLPQKDFRYPVLTTSICPLSKESLSLCPLFLIFPFLPICLLCWKFRFSQRTISFSNMHFIHISHTSGLRDKINVAHPSLSEAFEDQITDASSQCRCAQGFTLECQMQMALLLNSLLRSGLGTGGKIGLGFA